MTDNPTTHTPSSKLRAPLNALGVLALVLGLAVATFIYSSGHTRSPKPPTAAGDWQDSTLATADSKRSTHDIEMYSGKLGVLTVRLLDWSHQPDSRAILIATISVLAASACFLAANRLR